MKKIFAVALTAATIMGGTAAYAQSVDFGPNGPQLDLRSHRQRERDYDRVERMRDRDYDRRGGYRDRDLTTGSVGCREVTVRDRDAYGNVEVRRHRDCR